MKEVYLATSVSISGDNQMRVASIWGEDSAVIDARAAAAITEGLVSTGVIDHEAEILRDIFSGRPVSNVLYDGLDGLVDKLDAANDLTGALVMRLPEAELDQPDPTSLYEIVTHAVNGDGTQDALRDRLYYLNENGLETVDYGRNQGGVVQTDMYHDVTNDPVVEEIAEAFDLQHMAFEHELVYASSDEHGTVPELKSRRIHYALGNIAASGNGFNHFLTVLNETHPVRQHK